MKYLCNAASTTSSVDILYQWGSAPTDGGIQPWGVNYTATGDQVSPPVTTNGKCEAVLTYDGSSTLTLSGICKGLSGAVTSIYIYDSTGLQLWTWSYYSISLDIPFSYDYTVSDYDIAVVCDKGTYISFATYTYNSGEVWAKIDSGCPTDTSPCKPFVGTPPTKSIQCYSGAKQSFGGFSQNALTKTTCSAGELCGAVQQNLFGISQNAFGCYDASTCYICQSLSAGGFTLTQQIACCNGELCNCDEKFSCSGSMSMIVMNMFLVLMLGCMLKIFN